MIINGLIKPDITKEIEIPCDYEVITGRRIKRLRKEYRLSQKELAELLGVTRSVVSGWENGKRLPSVEQYCILAQAFRVEIEYLVGMIDEKIRMNDDDTYEHIVENVKKDIEKRDFTAEELLENGIIDINMFNDSGKAMIIDLYKLMRKTDKYLK